RGVQASSPDAEVIDEVLDRRGLVAPLPEEVERCVQRRVRVELLGPGHGRKLRILERPVKYLTRRRLDPASKRGLPHRGWVHGPGSGGGRRARGPGPRRTGSLRAPCPGAPENAESPRARRAAPRGSPAPRRLGRGDRGAAGGTVNAETRVVGGCGDRRVGQGSTGPDAGRCPRPAAAELPAGGSTRTGRRHE